MIINPTTVQNPTRTLFVSPGFPSGSPYYATIAAALAAADGVNPTTILVYPGTYIETGLTMKHNVTIRGVSRSQCLIFDSTNSGVILTINPVTGGNYLIENMSFLQTGNPGTAIEILAGSGIAAFSFQNCYIAGTLGIGIKLTNSNSYAHDFNLEMSTVVGAASANLGPLQFALGGVGTTFNVRRCYLAGEDSVYQCVGFSYNHCELNSGGIKVPDAGYTKFFRNCVIRNKAVTPGASTGATLYFLNCTLDSCAFTLSTGSSSAVWEFDNCSFRASAADGNIFDISAGTGSLRLRNCVLEDGKINFSAVLSNFLIAVNVTIRNPGGTLCIASGAFAVTVMLGNVSSDKALGVNVTNNGAGYNLQVSKPI